MQKIWDDFSAEEKQAIEARYSDLRDEYMTLQTIRKHKQVTQKDIAALLCIEQGNVSRMEKRKDMLLSTLTDYIEALGGELQINAVFPDNHVIRILNASKEERSTQ